MKKKGLYLKNMEIKVKEDVYAERALENPEIIEKIKGTDVVLYNVNCCRMYRAHINEDGSIQVKETVEESDLKYKSI